ncbi:helix-turn-helix domain-containing protein [Streptomyces jumonjinensis]|uniref:helix-turn-helix domain-containing protein n=1 Tax=Streptomyces jumonjinensis TaxID=1945 RepID=UPI0037BBFB52
MPAEKDLDPSGSLEEYIGDQVRQGRKEKGMTQRDLAGKVFSSTTRISEIESGDPPDRELARKLGNVLDLGDSLVNLVRILEGENVRDYAKPYLRRLSGVTMLHEFSTGVPGLLQTDAYVRGALQAGLAGEAAQIDDYVADRLERQKLLDQESPPWTMFVLDEAALHRETGGKAAMREQIAHLMAMSERPSVNIQVLPIKGVPVASTFTIITLATGARGAYSEGFSTGNYTEEQGEVLRFQRVYDLLQADALSVKASLEVMRTILKEHDD